MMIASLQGRADSLGAQVAQSTGERATEDGHTPLKSAVPVSRPH
jgi:hypothetical protein